MRPELRDGDVVLALTWRRLWRLKPGDRVIFRQPPYGTLIKKIERLGPVPGQLFVTGSTPTSVDSYEFGPVEIEQVLGKVVGVVKREA